LAYATFQTPVSFAAFLFVGLLTCRFAAGGQTRHDDTVAVVYAGACLQHHQSGFQFQIAANEF
jgi:hypothetical protein